MKTPSSLAKHRLIVLLSCMALALVWFCFIVLLTLLISRIDLSIFDGHETIYSWVQLFFGPLLLGVASLLTVPFAIWVFNRLKVMRPKLSAIALSTSFFFAFCLYGLILDVFPFMWYQNLWYAFAAIVISLAISLTVYGLIIRKLAKRVPRGWLLVIILGLPIATFLVDFFFRISVSFL